jgi:ComF family protein
MDGCTDTIFFLSHYADKSIRALIHEAKFHGNARANTLLNILVVKYLEKHVGKFDLIIPIPLSRARMRARGYNQVLEIINSGAEKLHIPIETTVLVRERDTCPQSELSRSERLTNLHDAFNVVHGEKIKGAHILLIDDVSTTGTTLKTAKAMLLPFKPASITLLAIAH